MQLQNRKEGNMYAEDIKKLTKENTHFRKVLHTGKYCQIVAMSIPVGGDIGEEVHTTVDQILFFVKGIGEAVLNGEARSVEEHDVVFVPAGTKHNFINWGDEDLKLFTVYAPPEHPDGTVHQTKEEAEIAEGKLKSE
jgi:mannose-6-phosphate isomerase-like protein (cupin superfamily)